MQTIQIQMKTPFVYSKKQKNKKKYLQQDCVNRFRHLYFEQVSFLSVEIIQKLTVDRTTVLFIGTDEHFDCIAVADHRYASGFVHRQATYANATAILRIGVLSIGI